MGFSPWTDVDDPFCLY